MNGENAKEDIAGDTVLLIRLVTPNINPSPDPILGPNRIEPMITGI